MRIVQTFWTAGQDPLKHAFGWLHPEYNLMSWALSCLSLREHYDEVALYTDSEGKRILIDKLHLPYTEENVVFDDFPCLPEPTDYRRTLYWNPNLRLDSEGRARVTLYNNSHTTQIQVEAAGQAADGTLLWNK